MAGGSLLDLQRTKTLRDLAAASERKVYECAEFSRSNRPSLGEVLERRRDLLFLELLQALPEPGDLLAIEAGGRSSQGGGIAHALLQHLDGPLRPPEVVTVIVAV